MSEGAPDRPASPPGPHQCRPASSGSLGLHPTNSQASFWELVQAGSCSRPGNKEGVNLRSQRPRAQRVHGGFPLKPSHESQGERRPSQSPADPSLTPPGRAHHLVTMPSLAWTTDLHAFPKPHPENQTTLRAGENIRYSPGQVPPHRGGPGQAPKEEGVFCHLVIPALSTDMEATFLTMLLLQYMILVNNLKNTEKYTQKKKASINTQCRLN